MTVKAAPVALQEQTHEGTRAITPSTASSRRTPAPQRRLRANRPLAVTTAQDKFTVLVLAPQRGERVLEVGCGNGHRLSLIAAAGATAVGVEASPERLRAARRRFPEKMLLQCDLAQPLPLAGGCFDAILCVIVGEHPERMPALLREMQRVLRPGGRIVLSLHYPNIFIAADHHKAPANLEINFYEVDFEMRSGPFRFFPQDYVTALHQAGFYDVRQHEDGNPGATPPGGKPLSAAPSAFPTQVVLQAVRPHLHG
ncbi:MAG: class I SAM-dependent methyltransferase [candidate division KSB1 bacterium]|nr:class I SAM-dependent methyltransferase [candidate division KSB1 bacterium]MDZ7273870.1 class I SAM-dependent methyltransferase [candidate division KSB1 bacterium]MDZ7286026.1 class I SAM-dependent methyltransferase [candidate division KSB1 bacterium]MDZ7299058.1 class I SAM-dependent methyltransferase [candidate division KSB1 bacterium]MDZ7308195.1 class I SAM-dependent methyltransferase [candidate division KSB1 bacterium]